MQDRQPGAPGQYKAILTAAEFQKMQAGEQFTITMTRDDQPIVEGTPYSKSAVLPDELAAIICPDVLNPTPADALSALLPRNGRSTMTGDLDMGSHRVKNVADPEEDGDAVPLKYAEDHFAPAGYGLGGSCITVDHWDNATANGFYYSVWGGPINGYDFQGIVIKYGDIIIQKVWRTWADTIISAERRRDSDGTWKPWDWSNPPMTPGEEYRTTKRHSGNVVYAKCVNLGTLPNTGKAQEYLAAEVRRVLSLDLIAVRSDGKSYFFDELNIAWELYWHTESDGLSLLITTKSDHSHRTGYAIMEYTKD